MSSIDWVNFNSVEFEASSSRKKAMRYNLPHTLNDSQRALLETFMFNAGVLPVVNPSASADRALKQLPPEEAKKFKRRFRKLWRKLARGSSTHGFQCGQNKKKPSRLNMTERKRLVAGAFYEKMVKPALDKFEAASVAKESSEANLK